MIAEDFFNSCYKKYIKHSLQGYSYYLDSIAGLHGISVEMSVVGDDVEYPPYIEKFIHRHFPNILNNVVKHGLEPPSQRKSKPDHCTVIVSVRKNKNRILIEIKDDGRGIDPNSIRQKMINLHAQPKDKIDALNDSEIFELLFTDGLSTAAHSDQYSGRGIGMAALKADILEQKGDAIFASKAGIGSTLTLVFPIR